MAKEIKGSKELKNAKAELFCWLYAGYHNRDLFGNGTRCYIQVYYSDEIEKLRVAIDTLLEKREKGYSVEVNRAETRIKSLERTARTQASTILAKPNIRARVDYLIDTYIENNYTDRELQYVILQRFDLNSKVQAIKEYNRLKSRGEAGNKLEGSFTFGWEGDDEEEVDKKTKKKPVLKKASVKSTVEWDEEEK